MDEFIFSYTRKQAIEDGVLIDITEIAREVGIKVPIAITSGLYHAYIKTNIPSQDETGRLWDIIFLFMISARYCSDSIMFFDVSFQITEDEYVTQRLKAVIGPGDTAEPVITIMLEHED
ncbi:hypothetical protein MASR2M48_34080 [Spirochaetota bacterium]